MRDEEEEWSLLDNWFGCLLLLVLGYSVLAFVWVRDRVIVVSKTITGGRHSE